MGALSKRRALASIWFGACAAAAIWPQAARAESEVKLTRPAPFDRWCVAPVCQVPAGQAAHAPLFQPPAELLPSASDGLLERELKQRLGNALSEQARKLDVWSKPVDDLSQSAVAALASDKARYERALGLTGAVARAALVLEVADAVPPQTGCNGSARLGAIYEGLSISIALAPLRFPAATHSVSASCVETAHAAEKLVDQQILAALLPENVRQGVQHAIAKVKAAAAACAPLLQPGALDSFADYQSHWAKLQQLRTPELPQSAPECSAALGGPDSVSLPELDELRKLGLEAASAALIEEALSAAAQAAQLQAQLRAQLDELLRAGQLGQQSLEVMLARLAAEWKPQALSNEIWGHLLDALRQALTVDAHAQHVSIDPLVVVKSLKDAYGLDENGVPTLRTLLGFKPTPWVAEANAGVPSLKSDDFRIIGDARLGYQGKHLGVVAHGGIKEFDLEQAGVATQDSHYFGGADGSFMLGDVRDKVRFELRLNMLVDWVSTTVAAQSTAAGGANFQDYDSTLIRAGGQLGLRVAPTEQLLLRVAASGGYQYETHDTTNLFKNNNFESVDTNSARFGGGLLFIYRVVPGVLGARVRGDIDYYKLTIDRLVFDFMGQPVVEQPQASQLEASARLFVDLDVASFGGFVPAAFAGIDYLARSGAGPDVTTSTPSFGLGLMRRSD
ncbi:MAG TPA: hypothetical protein VHB79_38335 [Polyangiaceae bacterium]|nr:hypothetical protein [Polyangiaceae bacterium]